MKRFSKIALLAALTWGLTDIAYSADEAAMPTPSELAAQAAAALEAQDAKTAVALYEQAVAADPDNPELLTTYANALAVRINEVNFMAKGMIAGKMLKAYQRSVEIDPDHVVGWIGQSRYYLNAPPIAGGSADKAETYAKEVLRLVPFLGHVELGLVAEKRGNLEAAAEHFRASLADQPEHREALAGLARVTSDA